MILCLDIGNTRTKAAAFKGRELIKESQIFDFDWDQTEDYYTKFPFSKVIISSTRSPIQELIEKLKIKTKEVYILNHLMKVFVGVHYDTPETLGPDRLAAVCGASKMFKAQNNLVIDAGTCITYDYLDQENIYHGGNIAPGIHMRLKAMHEFTSKLPYVDKKTASRLLGKSTNEALQNGAVLGVALEIEALFDRLIQEERQINIILTGGDALFLAENVKKEIFVVPNLVLLGLNEILLYNLAHED